MDMTRQIATRLASGQPLSNVATAKRKEKDLLRAKRLDVLHLQSVGLRQSEKALAAVSRVTRTSEE